jgi:hypothetical protein
MHLLRPARSPRFPNGPAAGGAEMCMYRRVAPAARPRPVGPSRRVRSVQCRAAPAWPAHGPRPLLGPRPAAPRGAFGSAQVMRSSLWRSAYVGPSGMAHGSFELVKAHTPRRGRPSCRNRSLLPSGPKQPGLPCDHYSDAGIGPESRVAGRRQRAEIASASRPSPRGRRDPAAGGQEQGRGIWAPSRAPCATARSGQRAA